MESVQNNFSSSLGFRTPTGTFSSEIDEGVKTKGGFIGLTFDKDFGDSGWALNGKFKYSDYKHKFGLWSDGDGVINVPETLQSFLTNRGLGSLANASFTFVGGGAVPANYLLFANRITDRIRPATDFTGELNLTKKLATGGIDHAITLGGFYGRASAGDYNVTTTFLAEFNNTPRLVNLTVTNPLTNVQTVVSANGLLNAGAGYVNNRHKAERLAGYLADQMKIGDRFNFDIGARIERINGDVSRERTSTVVTDASTPNLSTALRDVIWGNGGLAAVFLLPFPLVHSVPLVGALLFATSFGKGLFDGCIYAAMHDVMPDEARATAAGLMTMLGFIGAGISAVALPAIAAYTGLAAGFAMMAGLYLIAVTVPCR